MNTRFRPLLHPSPAENGKLVQDKIPIVQGAENRERNYAYRNVPDLLEFHTPYSKIFESNIMIGKEDSPHRAVSAMFLSQIDAISTHPPFISTIFFENRLAMQGHYSRLHRSSPHLNPVYIMAGWNYIISNSFIAAYYNLAGDSKRRDQARASCVMLLSTLGIPSEAAIHHHIELELIWEEEMKRRGIAKQAPIQPSISLSTVVVIAIALIFLGIALAQLFL